jgi:hypothetical protein
MHIRPEDFVLQSRGPYRFDRWQWSQRVATSLGDLVVELTSDDGKPPNLASAEAAGDLAEFAATHGELLLDLIHGHYCRAEQQGWLEFWGVPSGLGRDQVLSQVRSVVLTVRRKANGQFEAAVFVDPLWDPEHKLDLVYHDGRIISVNGN